MKRGRWQGTWTVLRFNWHFFALAAAMLVLCLAVGIVLWPEVRGWMLAMAGALFFGVALSLAATAWAYDFSGLYRFDWLEPWLRGGRQAANLHAGFDESSVLLRERFPELNWRVLDFFDPERHTEISIRRARAATPALPGTEHVSTRKLPFSDGGIDRALLLLAAHEIRAPEERVAFFRELRRSLADDGLVIVVEHLRDLPNLVAYNLGAWHFHARGEWLRCFEQAGFKVRDESRQHPLITTFVLEKDSNGV